LAASIAFVSDDDWASVRGGLTSYSAPQAINCPTYNTTEFTTGGAVVLSNCKINAGPYGVVFVTATGEVTCGALSDAQTVLVAGVGTAPYPATGAKVSGHISGGVLTITSMITPPSFTVATGQTLFDGNSGSGIPTSPAGSTLTITGPISGSGGVGTYSVSDNSVSVGEESIWALNVTPPGGVPPGGITLSFPHEDVNCRNGTTGVITITGAIPTTNGVQGMVLWFAILLTSENLGNNPQSASWNNGQISMIALGAPIPGF
jgi:hypothetical protein